MKKYKTEIRVIYGDTDKAGVVYYGTYYRFFETARGEMMRQMGFTYARMESLGFILPVIESHCTYIAPARYDDLIEVHASIGELGNIKMQINCEVFCNGKLLAKGHTVHAVVNHDLKPVRPPKEFLDAVRHAESQSI
jgi:acyl-CoA thioester hydrolase